MARIRRKHLHDALWFWWLENELGKIVERECARDMGFAQTAGMA